MEEKEYKASYKIIQPLILSACIAIGMMVGYKMNDKPDSTLISTMDYPIDSMMMTGRIEELIRFIENKYVDNVDSDKLISAAMTGIFGELDPHSIYLSPAETDVINDQMQGEYDGIGIENFIIQDTVNVSHVIQSSPAQKAGIKVFDKILAIDDKNVTGNHIKYDDVRMLLKKKPGETVKILILRDQRPLTLDVVVSEIEIKTVNSHYLSDIQTVLIKIDRFGDDTYREFMDDVELYFTKNNAKHLILDLRDNPGGFLPEATNILCQIFEEKDRLLLYTEGRFNKRNEYKSTGKRFFPIDQVVVLINENSASASEIIAGAIQDWDRGFIIGRRSFGKGLVQEQYNLNNGGAIRLTVARYFTPSGRSIQRDYSDKEVYDHDYESRAHNGDFFYKDSTLTKNGGNYKTLVLKRTVSGSGGIRPDIFIAMDTLYAHADYLSAFTFIPEFAFVYAAKHPKSFPLDSKSFENWTLPENALAEFNHFITSRSDLAKTVDKTLWSLIKVEVKKQIHLLLNKNTAIAFNTTDPFIAEAVKVISSKKSLADIK